MGSTLAFATAPRLLDRVRLLAAGRAVVVAGLPACGKTLLVHDVAVLAHSGGREVDVLQWDVARPPFEESEAGRRYPMVDGISQSVIIRAVGLWTRETIGAWAGGADERRFLVVEAPLIGGRLVELVRPADDAAEALLAGGGCVFALTAPTNEVRRHIEAERRRTFAAPRDAHEREEAPPNVIAETWRELCEVGVGLGVAIQSDAYDSASYRAVYERLLRHRRRETLTVDAVLETGEGSAYELPFARRLSPTAVETGRFIARAERDAGPQPWWSSI